MSTNRISATHLTGPVLMRYRRHSTLLRLRAAGAVGLLAAGLLAGCGGGAPASPSTKVMSAALDYANCMRSHGVTDFPDPDSKAEFQIQPVQVHNGVRTVSQDLLPSSPAFQDAQRVCGSLGSAGRQVTAAQERQEFHLTLEAAVCMRANGVPNYPDPKWLGGSIDANYSASLNLNPSSPAYLNAVKKCGHGLPLIGTVGG
jgi:hypothetical protein